MSIIKYKYFYLLILIICCYSCNNANKNQTSFLTKINKELSLNDKQTKEVRVEILAPLDYVNWINKGDEIIYKTVRKNKVSFNLKLLPQEYLAIRECGLTEIKNIEKFKACKLKYSELIYFQFEIIPTTELQDSITSSFVSLNRLTKFSTYLAFDIKSNFKLLNGPTSRECSLLSYDNTFDFTKTHKYLLAFSNKNINYLNDISISYNDVVFCSDEIKFNFSKREITSIPKLAI